PPQRMIPAGPLAGTARPRKKPKREAAKEGEEVNDVSDEAGGCGDDCFGAEMGERSGGTRQRRILAATMAMLNMALKGMSVAAAGEKLIMPTVVGRRSRSQRAVSGPYRRRASHAIARVVRSAETALGRRAAASLTPKSLKLRAAPQ